MAIEMTTTVIKNHINNLSINGCIRKINSHQVMSCIKYMANITLGCNVRKSV